jgi:acetylornithine deacetylase/succinyl-diaminopimelate desuccinylase-like protein
MELRAAEKCKLDHGDCLLGEVTTVNLTILRAGVQHNVVPAEAEAGFDIRLPPSVDLPAFKATLDQWAAESVLHSLSTPHLHPSSSKKKGKKKEKKEKKKKWKKKKKERKGKIKERGKGKEPFRFAHHMHARVFFFSCRA